MTELAALLMTRAHMCEALANLTPILPEVYREMAEQDRHDALIADGWCCTGDCCAPTEGGKRERRAINRARAEAAA